MDASTSVIAKDLTPPFIVAILHDTDVARKIASFEPRPSDEMVSLAPSQKGFLGIETARDEKGRWLSVSYWQDIAAYNTWRQACARRITEIFPGKSLESLCRVKVADITRPLVTKHTHQLKADKPATSKSHYSNRISRFSKLMPSIMEYFGHVPLRRSR